MRFGSISDARGEPASDGRRWYGFKGEGKMGHDCGKRIEKKEDGVVIYSGVWLLHPQMAANGPYSLFRP